jgi:hypothetical protein
VDSPSIFLFCELAAAALGAALQLVLALVFIYGYVRCGRLFFLILCVGAVGFVVINSYAALLVYSALVRTPILPAPIMRGLTALYVAAFPVAEITTLVGMILLVRFAVRLYTREKT